MITPQGLICIFWAESLSEYQLCIPVKVRQTSAVKDWSLLLFPWQSLSCKNQLFSLPFLSLIRVWSRDFRFRRLLTSTRLHKGNQRNLVAFFTPGQAIGADRSGNWRSQSEACHGVELRSKPKPGCTGKILRMSCAATRSWAVSATASSYPTSAANGANCAALSCMDIRGRFVETWCGRFIISSYRLISFFSTQDFSAAQYTGLPPK